MNEIQKKIKLFLNKYNLDKPEYIYIVAFSGGYDSMCLLDCLKKISPNRLIAIHLNHNLRGKESDQEEKNCAEFCQKNGIEFYSEKLSSNIAHTETAAREARYNFFEKCAEKYNSKIIFTAHNKNDNIETLLYRICKGTGVYGLQGIAQHRNIYYRPLLDILRKDIEIYCEENKLQPNNDSSNKNPKYKRNFIRTKIIPELQHINPYLVSSIDNLCNVAKEETEIVEEYTNIILNKICKNGKIQTKKFLKLSDAIQKRIIYNIFIKYNLDYERTKIVNILNFIKENSDSKAGKISSLTTNLWIYANTKDIEIIKNKQKTPISIKVTTEGTYENDDYIFKIEKFTTSVDKFPSDEENYAYVNLDNLPINFKIRPRENGDIIQPLGLNGSQKLKKYLNSKKIPNHEKDTLLFLATEKEILWAIGLGISDKIKVTTNPTHKITFYKKR